MSIRVVRPWLAATSVALGLVALPLPASAWVDVHVAGDDVRVDVEKDGSARVEHKITLRISGGPLRSIDLRGIDPDAVPEPDAYVVPARDAATNSLASAAPVTTEMLPPPSRPRDDGTPSPSAMRLRFDADKGLSRGVFVVFVRYRSELFRRGLIKRDDSMARLTWSGLLWEDGFDSARATFVLPSGATEPRPAEITPVEGADEGPTPPSVLSTLRRATGHDELELLRPYAPKGERVAWHVRFDARALDVTAPRPADAATSATPAKTPLAPERRDVFLLAGGLVFVLYSLLVALKGREVERTAKEAGAEPQPLIPAPLFARAVLAGVALTAGLGLQAYLPTGTAGALSVALAAAFAAHRAPRWTRTSSLRGPGAWLPITEEEAFARALRPRGAFLDVSTRAGKVLFALALILLGGAAWFVSGTSMYHAELLAYDAVALLALFCTGRLAELPPDPVASAAPFLRGVAKRVRKAAKKAGEEVRIVPRIRVPEGSAKADELRLGIVPRSPLPGFSGLEVGVVLTPAAGGTLRSPEVLLRITSGTTCEAAMHEISDLGTSRRGRKPNERVVGLTPQLPTAWMTADLVTRLLGVMREARKGSEREERSGIRRSTEATGLGTSGRAA